MSSFLPARQTAMRPEIELRGAVVAVNSCILCYGTQVCHECGGAGRRPGKRDCLLCRDSGRCGNCREHCEALRTFALQLHAGSYGEAEADLQGRLIRVAKQETGDRSTFGIGGAGVGAILGSIVAPGLGTLVGMSVGKMLGDGVDPHQPWLHADLLYCLGVLYAAQGRQGESKQAWIKALAVHQGHVAARTALRTNP